MKCIANTISSPASVVVIPQRIGYRQAKFYIIYIQKQTCFTLYVQNISNTDVHAIHVNGQTEIKETLPFDLEEVDASIQQQTIPRVILTDNSTEILRVLNPEYTIKTYRNEAKREFIQKHYNDIILDAFDSLPQFRDNIFVAAYLFMYGGVYIKTGVSMLVPLKECISPDDTIHMCLSLDERDTLNSSIDQTMAYSDKLIFVEPKHPAIGAMLRAYKILQTEDKYHNLSHEVFFYSVASQYVNMEQVSMKELQSGFIVKYSNREPIAYHMKPSTH